MAGDAAVTGGDATSGVPARDIVLAADSSPMGAPQVRQKRTSAAFGCP